MRVCFVCMRMLLCLRVDVCVCIGGSFSVVHVYVRPLFVCISVQVAFLFDAQLVGLKVVQLLEPQLLQLQLLGFQLLSSSSSLPFYPQHSSQ